MRNTKLKYKGFIGDAQYSKFDKCFYGSILNTNDLVSYEGRTLDELTKEFKTTVNTYIDMCAEIGFSKLSAPKLFNQSKFYILIKIFKNLLTLKEIEDIKFTNIKKVFTHKKSACLVNYNKKEKKYLGLVKHRGKWYTISSKTLEELNYKFKSFIAGQIPLRTGRKYIKLK